MNSYETIADMSIDNLIRMAIDVEAEKAREKYGRYFNSHHEAWAVLKEEIEEVGQEAKQLDWCMDDLWMKVKTDEDPELTLVRMKGIAKRFMLEAIQVAAVIDKYSRTNDLVNQSKEEKK